MTDPIPDFDLYAELEVSDRASGETIAAAWRSLAKRNHPDVSADPVAAAHRMARLNVARDWLIDPPRRARYDSARGRNRRDTSPGRTSPPESSHRAGPTPPDPARPSPTQPEPEPATKSLRWRLPPHRLLDGASRAPVHDANRQARDAWSEAAIVAKLGSFGIDARIVGRNTGPSVTQYEVQLAPHVKVSRVEALSRDLQLALAARSIRIEAPIPGKSAVGIEIPNGELEVVSLRRILEEVDFRGSPLMMALGRDVAGKAVAVDLARLGHLLIAGATGSGKSTLLNALITSLLCNATPDEMRLILVDTKRVELGGFSGVPHLLVPVIPAPQQARAALVWSVNEMSNRYRRFVGAQVRDIRGFNESRVDPADRLPYIVIAFDELADVVRDTSDVADPIARLAQEGRAAGIHLVISSSRPSIPIVGGLAKSNLVSRVAFAMASQVDSRLILDAPGAENLIGRGDMLYRPLDLPSAVRLQGVLVSDAEIGRVTEHWRSQVDGEPQYDPSIVSEDWAEDPGREPADEAADRLLPEAIEVIREYDRASASLLQRRLRIGYARAARIIDQLEVRGYLGPFDGSNARLVLRRDGRPADEDETVDARREPDPPRSYGADTPPMGQDEPRDAKREPERPSAGPAATSPLSQAATDGGASPPTGPAGPNRGPIPATRGCLPLLVAVLVALLLEVVPRS